MVQYIYQGINGSKVRISKLLCTSVPEDCIWAMTYDSQLCGIFTSYDSDEPVQPSFKLRNYKCCLVSSLKYIEYSSD